MLLDRKGVEMDAGIVDLGLVESLTRIAKTVLQTPMAAEHASEVNSDSLGLARLCTGLGTPRAFKGV